MRDFNKNELAIGDYVAFLEPNYRHMHEGRVVGFTAKQIRIEYRSTYQTWRNIDGFEQCLREPNYVAKIQHNETVDAEAV